MVGGCLLYTSDAADDLLCVDLGGRRIIKKKKKKYFFFFFFFYFFFFFFFVFFFFKQKTAYEIASCLVGSEMCIRDRNTIDTQVIQAELKRLLHQDCQKRNLMKF